jgi:glycine cleavage system H protein
MPRYFTLEHEWIDVDGNVGRVGITDYAQGQLGDITYVDVPALGAVLARGDSAAVVDSVKAASDIYAPVGGTVTAVNAALADAPDLVNSSAETDGWLWTMELSDPSQLGGLMDAAAYAKLLADQ